MYVVQAAVWFTADPSTTSTLSVWSTVFNGKTNQDRDREEEYLSGEQLVDWNDGHIS